MNIYYIFHGGLVGIGVFICLDLARWTLADWIWFFLLGYHCLVYFEIVSSFIPFPMILSIFTPSIIFEAV